MRDDSLFLNLIEIGTVSDLKQALEIYQINAKDEEGMTLLSWAALAGSKRKVSFLLEQGADVNMADNNGMTPLMYAASNNYPDIIELLLIGGADIQKADVSGWTAETWADVLWNEKSKALLRERRKRICSQTLLKDGLEHTLERSR